MGGLRAIKRRDKGPWGRRRPFLVTLLRSALPSLLPAPWFLRDSRPPPKLHFNYRQEGLAFSLTAGDAIMDLRVPDILPNP